MEQKKFWEAVAEEMFEIWKNEEFENIIEQHFDELEKDKDLEQDLEFRKKEFRETVFSEEESVILKRLIKIYLKEALDNVIANYETEAQKKFREGLNIIVSRKSA